MMKNQQSLHLSAVTVNTDVGKCETAKDNVNLGVPTFSDNCSGTTITNDAPAVFTVGTTTVTWTATDASGNTATATQLITIEDHELPGYCAAVGYRGKFGARKMFRYHIITNSQHNRQLRCSLSNK